MVDLPVDGLAHDTLHNHAPTRNVTMVTIVRECLCGLRVFYRETVKEAVPNSFNS